MITSSGWILKPGGLTLSEAAPSIVASAKITEGVHYNTTLWCIYLLFVPFAFCKNPDSVLCRLTLPQTKLRCLFSSCLDHAFVCRFLICLYSCFVPDKVEGNKFAKDFEDNSEKLQEFVTFLDKELKTAPPLLEALGNADIFYEMQYKEVKIVANVSVG